MKATEWTRRQALIATSATAGLGLVGCIGPTPTPPPAVPSGPPAHPLSTGYPSIDRALLGGLGRGELTVVAGLFGMGAPYLVRQIAVAVAETGNKVVYWAQFDYAGSTDEWCRYRIKRPVSDTFRAVPHIDSLEQFVGACVDADLVVVDAIDFSPWDLKQASAFARSRNVPVLVAARLEASARGKLADRAYAASLIAVNREKHRALLLEPPTKERDGAEPVYGQVSPPEPATLSVSRADSATQVPMTYTSDRQLFAEVS